MCNCENWRGQSNGTLREAAPVANVLVNSQNSLPCKVRTLAVVTGVCPESWTVSALALHMTEMHSQRLPVVKAAKQCHSDAAF